MSVSKFKIRTIQIVWVLAAIIAGTPSYALDSFQFQSSAPCAFTDQMRQEECLVLAPHAWSPQEEDLVQSYLQAFSKRLPNFVNKIVKNGKTKLYRYARGAIFDDQIGKFVPFANNAWIEDDGIAFTDQFFSLQKDKEVARLG